MIFTQKKEEEKTQNVEKVNFHILVNKIYMFVVLQHFDEENNAEF